MNKNYRGLATLALAGALAVGCSNGPTMLIGHRAVDGKPACEYGPDKQERCTATIDHLYNVLGDELRVREIVHSTAYADGVVDTDTYWDVLGKNIRCPATIEYDGMVCVTPLDQEERVAAKTFLNLDGPY